MQRTSNVDQQKRWFHGFLSLIKNFESNGQREKPHCNSSVCIPFQPHMIDLVACNAMLRYAIILYACCEIHTFFVHVVRISCSPFLLIVRIFGMHKIKAAQRAIFIFGIFFQTVCCHSQTNRVWPSISSRLLSFGVVAWEYIRYNGSLRSTIRPESEKTARFTSSSLKSPKNTTLNSW